MMIPVPINGDSRGGGGHDFTGEIIGVLIMVVGVIAGIVLGQWHWILAVPVGALIFWANIRIACPLTDEEKRAFGKHLPPHLRGR